MSMRPIRLPQDLKPLTDMLVRTFQYPEHPEWSIKPDEQEDIVQTIRSLRRLWPLLRVFQVFSPSLRDIFRGFVWEEGGDLVGVVLTQRRGSTAVWHVGVVGVLPEHRGKGIARQLLTRSLEQLRGRGAEKVILGVIDRNVPAYGLYRSLGFEHYSGVVELNLTPTSTPRVPPLPAGVRQETVKLSDWRVRYELDRRIAPPELEHYDPIEIGAYRPPTMLRLFLPILRILQRRDQRRMRIDRTSDGTTVGLGRVDVPKRAGGVDSIRIALDPECPELADYLVSYHTDRAAARGPGRRIDLSVPTWMPGVIEAAEAQGYARRLEYHLLGLNL